MNYHGTGPGRESVKDHARRAREELNDLSFANDYGFDALKLVREELGMNKFYEQVSLQRAQARVNGRILMDADGTEHRLDKIDLTQMGLSATAITKVEELHAAEQARTKQDGPRSPLDHAERPTGGPGQRGL